MCNVIWLNVILLHEDRMIKWYVMNIFVDILFEEQKLKIVYLESIFQYSSIGGREFLYLYHFDLLYYYVLFIHVILIYYIINYIYSYQKA